MEPQRGSWSRPVRPRGWSATVASGSTTSTGTGGARRVENVLAVHLMVHGVCDPQTHYFEYHRIGSYGPADHFDLHRDDWGDTTLTRRWAISVLLTEPDEYMGGALVIPEAGLTIRPPANTAIIFPAHALHGVQPVTGGERRVYLTFLHEVTQ